jgi:hypothetical protein
MLRDRLDADLVSVAWARPEGVAAAVAALDPGPWVVAGGEPALPASALDSLRKCLFAALWVGAPPEGLPVQPQVYAGWQELAATLSRRMATPAAGLRLASSRGLVLPDGAVVGNTSHLEALLAAAPGGLQMTGHGGRSLTAAVRRAAAHARRHDLPLRVVVAGGRALVEPA